SPVGVPATTRCDAAIDFAWGRGKPQGTAVGPNLFSVRWTRSFKFTRSSTLQFTATGVDDGLRVTVDGIAVIDAWTTKAGNRTGQTGILPKGRHKVVVEYFDRSGIARVDVAVTRVPSPATADATAPETTLTRPAAGASVSEGTTRLAGNANDNVGVTGVRVAVRDTAAGLWLQADGTWAEGYVTRLATLVDPGRATTAWSIGVPLPPGAYFAEVRARDAAGNVDQSASTVSFTVT
nr:hypothetical protein [Acidimicrobiia bacterium]